jgi:predicted metal-binding membrane protein
LTHRNELRSPPLGCASVPNFDAVSIAGSSPVAPAFDTRPLRRRFASLGGSNGGGFSRGLTATIVAPSCHSFERDRNEQCLRWKLPFRGVIFAYRGRSRLEPGRPRRRPRLARMTAEAERTSTLRLTPTWAAALLLLGALVTWIVTLERMRGMDMGPGTDLGGLAWFIGIWVTMMAAMMLPSVAPMVLVFARVTRERAHQQRGAFVPTWIFIAGYLAVWTAYGIVAYAAYRVVDGFDMGLLAWDRGGPYVVGSAVALAGLYQLTPLKRLCLRHCRGPLDFIFGGWRGGRYGALRMGGEHGLYCVGCCWGLFLILFAVGVMSLFWMAVIAAVIFVEKVVPYGERLSRSFAFAFVALGVWIAAAPSSVPGLIEPGLQPSMQMRMDQ